MNKRFCNFCCLISFFLILSLTACDLDNSKPTAPSNESTGEVTLFILENCNINKDLPYSITRGEFFQKVTQVGLKIGVSSVIINGSYQTSEANKTDIILSGVKPAKSTVIINLKNNSASTIPTIIERSYVCNTTVAASSTNSVLPTTTGDVENRRVVATPTSTARP